jgi:Zn-finger nucleic acid-binding protein
MKCPNCSIDMKQCSVKITECSSVIVDQCSLCGGVWFDKNELYQFSEIPDSILAIDKQVLAKPVITKASLNCPVCGKPLTRYNDPVFKNMVVFMICRNCEGIWMNSKEIMNYAEFRKHFNKDQTLQKIVQIYNDPEFVNNLKQSPSHSDLTSIPDVIIKTALTIIQLMFGII